MSNKLNSVGAAHASSLVKAGKVKDSAKWEAPSTDAENAYIEKNGMGDFGKWFLAIDPDQDPENKGHYSYPFTNDFESIDLAGVRAIITRAAQSGAKDVEEKAQALLDASQKDEKKSKNAEDSIVERVVNAFKDFVQPSVLNFKNHKGEVWLSVVRNYGSDEPAIVTVDGPIGRGLDDSTGIASADFRKALNSIPKNKKIEAHINSPGGSVSDASVMHSLLKERGDNATCYVDGYGVSSASLVALGGHKTYMAPAAMMMIHEPSALTFGDKSEHERAADMLEKHGDNIAKIYAEKTGKTPEQMRQMMKDTTWMDKDAAINVGLADVAGECPSCGHEFCDECQADDGDIECSECGETAPISEWEKSGKVQNKFRQVKMQQEALNSYGALPPVVLNLLNPRPTPSEPVVKTDMSKENTNPPVQDADVNSLRAEVNRLREQRVSDKIDSFISQCRMTNDERADAIKRAMADEGYLDVIAKRPAYRPGAEAVGPNIIVESCDTVFNAIKAAKTPGERNQIRFESWAKLMAHAQAQNKARYGSSMPMMSDSYDTGLFVTTLADAAITQLVATLPSFTAFTRDFSAAPVGPLNNVVVPLTTQGGTLQKGTVSSPISDYTVGDGAISAVTVPMTEYSEGFYLTPAELMTGAKIEWKANHALQSLGKQLVTDTLQVLNTATYTAGSVANGTLSGHWGTWAWNVAGSTAVDMGSLRAAIGASPVKNAILEPTFFSKLIEIKIIQGINLGQGLTAQGFQNVAGFDKVMESTAWPANMGLPNTVGSVCGFSCNPQAIVVAARLPVLAEGAIPGNIVTQSTIEIPGLGMSVLLSQWFDPKSRRMQFSYGLVFGAAAGDTTALCVLKSLGA